MPNRVTNGRKAEQAVQELDPAQRDAEELILLQQLTAHYQRQAQARNGLDAEMCPALPQTADLSVAELLSGKYADVSRECVEHSMLPVIAPSADGKAVWSVQDTYLAHHQVNDIFEDTTLLGASSAEGFAMKSVLQHAANGLQVIVKTPQNGEQGNAGLMHEGFVGLTAAKMLREVVPNFAQVLSVFQCGSPSLVGLPKALFDKSRQVKSWKAEVPGSNLQICNNLTADIKMAAEQLRQDTYEQLLTKARIDLQHTVAKLLNEIAQLRRNPRATRQQLQQLPGLEREVDYIASLLQGPMLPTSQFEQRYIKSTVAHIASLQQLVSSNTARGIAVSDEVTQQLQALHKRLSYYQSQVYNRLNLDTPTTHLVYEFVEGPPLSRILDEITTPAELLSLQFQIACSLNYAFKRVGFQHGDAHGNNAICRKLPTADPNQFTRYPSIGNRQNLDILVRTQQYVVTWIDYGRSSCVLQDKLFSCTDRGCSTTLQSKDMTWLNDFLRSFVSLYLGPYYYNNRTQQRLVDSVKGVVLGTLHYIKQFIAPEDVDFEVHADSKIDAVLFKVHQNLSFSKYRWHNIAKCNVHGLLNHIVQQRWISQQQKDLLRTAIQIVELPASPNGDGFDVPQAYQNIALINPMHPATPQIESINSSEQPVSALTRNQLQIRFKILQGDLKQTVAKAQETLDNDLIDRITLLDTALVSTLHAMQLSSESGVQREFQRIDKAFPTFLTGSTVGRTAKQITMLSKSVGFTG